MSRYSLSHLSDGALLCSFTAVVARARGTTAELLAHIAEVDERKLYLPAGYPSMFSYCVTEFRFSEDEACKRIAAARAARRFPAIFDAIAEGRMNLSGVVMLAPHLTPQNAGELLAEASGKRNFEIEELIARRYPRTELLPMVTPLPAAPSQVAARPVAGQDSPALKELSAVRRMESPVPPQKLAPIAAERFGYQFSTGRATHDKFRRAQELMNCTDIEQIFDAALDALNEKLEKRKCGATSRPRKGPVRSSQNLRHIPRVVKRAVWKRDRGQCAFVSDTGHRCEARMGLEFDHLVPVAQGGTGTVDNIRLLCRAHNQHEAERTYGAAFMNGKREAARAAR
jgi:5-methylcytosine-specific restriction endonuclease McrA